MLISQREEQVEAAGALPFGVIADCRPVLLHVASHICMCCRCVFSCVPLGYIFSILLLGGPGVKNYISFAASPLSGCQIWPLQNMIGAGRSCDFLGNVM